MSFTINGIPDVPFDTPAGVCCPACGHALTVGDRLAGNPGRLLCPACGAAALGTCTDCHAPLRHETDQLFQLCEPCMDKWFALAAMGAPSRSLPVAHAAAHDGEVS